MLHADRRLPEDAVEFATQRIRHLAYDHDQRLAQTQSDSQPGRHQSESDFELPVELLEPVFDLIAYPHAERIERADKNCCVRL